MNDRKQPIIPLSTAELARDAEGKDRPSLKPSDARGHSLPASESSAEPETQPTGVPAVQLPPD